MKLYIIDRKPSALRLEIEDLEKRLNQSKIVVHKLNADDALSTQKLELYAIMQFPAILITNDDGQLARLWQGSIPLYDDITAAVAAS